MMSVRHKHFRCRILKGATFGAKFSPALCEAKVGEFGDDHVGPSDLDQDIFRLDVAMNDAIIVEIIQRLKKLIADNGPFLGSQTSMVGVHLREKCTTRCIFHDEEWELVLGLPEIDESDNMILSSHVSVRPQSLS